MPTPAQPLTSPTPRPRRLLTQNREMKAIGVWNWTLPAWAGRLPDGRTYNTCPSAGICAQVCYARNGTYAGDFFSDDYTRAWMRVMRAHRAVTFYAYTKEVVRFRRLIEPDPPLNFLWVYSYGGRHDRELDPARDRIADVFPDADAITAASWASQEASDLLAVLGPRLVGVPANRIPHYLARLDGRRFSEWQAQADRERSTRRDRSARPRPPRRARPTARPAVRSCDRSRPVPTTPRTRPTGSAETPAGLGPQPVRETP